MALPTDPFDARFSYIGEGAVIYPAKQSVLSGEATYIGQSGSPQGTQTVTQAGQGTARRNSMFIGIRI